MDFGRSFRNPLYPCPSVKSVVKLSFRTLPQFHSPMSFKRLPDLIIVACLAALIVWWRWPATPATPSVAPAVIVSHLPAPVVTTDVPPPGAPADAPPAPPVVTVVIPSAPVDPQAELGTAISDLIRLAQAGDAATMFQNYIQPSAQAGMSEQVKTNMIYMMQNEAASPQGLLEMQYIQSSTPTMDPSGNRATYTFPPGNPRGSLSLVKVNGRWYFE